MKSHHRELLKLGFFGSYSRGDWGVGSDLDLIAVVETTTQPFENRAMDWDYSDLPVPVDLLIYTIEEWKRLEAEETRFIKTMRKETVWLDLAEKAP
jgi:predicted nucleotidyltransferase